VERLRRERREAAAKEGRTGGAPGAGEELQERFYKMPRMRFLLLLCREISRVNRWVGGGLWCVCAWGGGGGVVGTEKGPCCAVLCCPTAPLRCR